MAKERPLYFWINSRSNTSTRLGVFTTSLFVDGSLECDCPGWVFKKPGTKARTCKHTRQVTHQVEGLLLKSRVGDLDPLVPSPAVTAGANELLLIPNAMLLMARQLADINKQINQVADDFANLVSLIVKKTAPAPPTNPPGIFFLNEAHETHITKSQARREREAARDARLAKTPADKKPAGKGKSTVGPLAPRKRRTIGTVRR